MANHNIFYMQGTVEKEHHAKCAEVLQAVWLCSACKQCNSGATSRHHHFFSPLSVGLVFFLSPSLVLSHKDKYKKTLAKRTDAELLAPFFTNVKNLGNFSSYKSLQESKAVLVQIKDPSYYIEKH